MRFLHLSRSLFFNKQISFKASILVITFAIAIFSYLAIPMKVTVDGINYISSAKALFSERIVDLYVWYREPGYPLLIKAIHAISDNAGLFVFFQGAILGLASAIAFFVIRKASGQTSTTFFQISLAILLVANPVMLIYSGLVLQQALFALILSLFGLSVWAVFQNRKRSNLISLMSMTIVIYAFAVITSIGWIYLGFAPVFVVLYRGLSQLFSIQAKINGNFQVKIWNLSKLLAIALLAASVTLLLGNSTYKLWTEYKTNNMPVDYSTPNVISQLENVPYIPPPQEIASRMLSIMSIGLQDNYVYENKLFLDQQMRRIWPLSEFDTAYVSHPYSDAAANYFDLTNPNRFVHSLVSVSSVFAINIYRSVFIASLLVMGLTIFQRKWLLLLVQLLPWWFIFIYAASNSPIDRYGVPAFPFAAASLGWAISVFLSKFANTFRKIC